MMNLGFVSAIVPELSFEEVISFAAANGFSCVELMCWPKGKADRKYAGVTHIDAGELDADSAARIKACLQEKRVFISALGYYPNPLDADPEKAEFYIAHLKRVIDAAALLGVGTVNTFIGRDPMTDLEANFKRFASVWPPIIAYAEGKGVRIAIENCPMYFTKDEWPAGKNLAFSPAVWRRMFETIPSKSLGLNYDPSHLLWQQIDYLRPIQEFKDRIFHVHLKDAKIDFDRLADVGILATPLEFHQPKLPGLGGIDWGRFVSALTDVRYEGPACIEVEDRAFEADLDSRKAAIVQSERYLRQFIIG
jgi:sugar phosphate isomerase/epimerase